MYVGKLASTASLVIKFGSLFGSSLNPRRPGGGVKNGSTPVRLVRTGLATIQLVTIRLVSDSTSDNSASDDSASALIELVARLG